MKPTRNLTALSIAMLLLAAVPMQAESVSGTMQVSVQVIARAVVTIDSQPASVNVTAEDIARGYVDVEAPIVVRVRTNSRQGYLLQVENQSESFSSIELTSGNVAMNVGSHESLLRRPYVSGGDVMPLRARLHLSSAATPGSFVLPLAFAASPL